jgi:hypothetical protein
MKALAVIALVASCGFELPAQPTANAHPIANAGTGSSYPLGSTVTLDGSLSFDPDGGALTYHWTILAAPDNSAAAPADASAATTTLVLDQFGTYQLQLEVIDDAHGSDTSEVTIVGLGVIDSVDAGSPQNVAWAGTVQLAGNVVTKPGYTATYAWSFTSRPFGSKASLAGADTLTPTFVADVVGTYAVQLVASVGDESVSDVTGATASATGVRLFGTDVVAYTYAKSIDRIITLENLNQAELAVADPATGPVSGLNLGFFTARSITLDPTGTIIGVGGVGKVATVTVSPLKLLLLRSAPGCTASHVIVPFSTRVDCFPADGSVEPISSVNMTTNVVTKVPSPVRFPDVTLNSPGTTLYMVDGASDQFITYDAQATPPYQTATFQGSSPGVGPPVFPGGSSQPFAVTGSGLVINEAAQVLFDLGVPVSTAAFSADRFELAVASGHQLIVVTGDGQTVKLSASIPPVNNGGPFVRLVAYSKDEHRLIIVADDGNGDTSDVAYTVQR